MMCHPPEGVRAAGRARSEPEAWGRAVCLPGTQDAFRVWEEVRWGWDTLVTSLES